MSEDGSQKRTRFRAVRQVTLVLGGALVGLLLAEGLARLFLPRGEKQIALLRMRAPDLQMDAASDLRHPGYNPFIQRRPYSEWTCDGHSPEPMNNEGFRDRDFAEAKAPGVFRLAVIGDSFAEGWMVPRDTAFPRVVERDLGPSFDIENFSMANRSPIRYLALYDRIVCKYRPDAVLLCLYRNDPAEDEALRPYVKFDARGVPSAFDYARYFRHTPRMPQTKGEKRRDRWQWRLCQWSRLFPYAAAWLWVDPEFRRRTLETPPPSKIEPLWRMTSDYLSTLKNLVEEDGARFLLALPPDPEDFEKPQAIFALAIRWAEAHSIPFFRAEEFLASPEPARFYLPNDGHFSAAGHATYGRELAGWLRTHLAPPAPTAEKNRNNALIPPRPEDNSDAAPLSSPTLP
ncbi:MAG: hypothetical protein IT578_11165 [Verrucomicrobiae bacterium]|nr:hypothetical protein [Verrucomicrobiae bacterium]